METLNNHNRRAYEAAEQARRTSHLAGVACNDCGTEMHLTNPGHILLSDPPQQDVNCPVCGARGYKVAG